MDGYLSSSWGSGLSSKGQRTVAMLEEWHGLLALSC